MHLSIIGSPGCGKSTLFQALSGNIVGNRSGSDHVAVIDVPDYRIDELVRIFKPKKTIYTRITLADTAAIMEGDIKSDNAGVKNIQQMRGSDALLLTLRNFDNGGAVRLRDEFLTIYSEFIISDMIQIEGRMERIRRQGVKKDNTLLAQEEEILSECLAHLSEEKPLSTAAVFNTGEKQLRNFQFLSGKPMMVVVNSSDERNLAADSTIEELRNTIPDHIPILSADGKLEAELALMSEEEQKVFMEEYGIQQSVRGRIIRMASEMLGLISFLTVGEDECRAWPVRNGSTAQDAAAAIHTDLGQKFIRAETVSYSDFINSGGFAECKKKGLWRLEGKTYVVQDGDILSIRAGN
ncbi:MAG: redox-regulated ATPase YchF [Deltaproteobacteria bacterium]|nr:redox-regulated ATPase YchF [Candidatus Zymogenaceae bacterium]